MIWTAYNPFKKRSDGIIEVKKARSQVGEEQGREGKK
jgi:hypothetical protein